MTHKRSSWNDLMPEACFYIFLDKNGYYFIEVISVKTKESYIFDLSEGLAFYISEREGTRIEIR